MEANITTLLVLLLFFETYEQIDKYSTEIFGLNERKHRRYNLKHVINNIVFLIIYVILFVLSLCGTVVASYYRDFVCFFDGKWASLI